MECVCRETLWSSGLELHIQNANDHQQKLSLGEIVCKDKLYHVGFKKYFYADEIQLKSIATMVCIGKRNNGKLT